MGPLCKKNVGVDVARKEPSAAGRFTRKEEVIEGHSIDIVDIYSSLYFIDLFIYIYFICLLTSLAFDS
jgi:hypothetical protein